jgi:hypothetical protein
LHEVRLDEVCLDDYLLPTSSACGPVSEGFRPRRGPDELDSSWLRGLGRLRLPDRLQENETFVQLEQKKKKNKNERNRANDNFNLP